MSKREEFKLEFYKERDRIDGDIYYVCISEVENNPYGSLNFLSFLDSVEIEYFINEISIIQKGLIFDPDFIYTGGTEGIMIEFNNPYFLIDNYLNIHMDDLKSILQEYKDFQKQNPVTFFDRIIMLLYKFRQMIKLS
ncbi:hypothetical protein [Mucilaginibacter terrae]|uniref:CDI immunity protein domain-containing protein n=1 Tax=Mucilaginibacter terrae TaxID=1955052 RepID=A0ABU3GX40_9SPHI|nr:hypothetical protein [Mucilaginibacter terrae]MDT3404333.1 hypothetical protein [Mucilaginibacter terrae]